jgi:hypothetical protein
MLQMRMFFAFIKVLSTLHIMSLSTSAMSTVFQRYFCTYRLLLENVVGALLWYTFVCLFFWVGLGFKFRLCACKAGTFLLEPYLLSILLWLFWRWGFSKYLPEMSLNLNSPNLSPSSWDYRHESLVPGLIPLLKLESQGW